MREAFLDGVVAFETLKFVLASSAEELGLPRELVAGVFLAVVCVAFFILGLRFRRELRPQRRRRR